MPKAKRQDPDSPAFVLENVGPVKKARFELGDLTIIAGRNNTGKTYIVYTLYGFLKCIRDFSRVRRLLANTGHRRPSEPPILQQITKQVVDNEEGVIQFDEQQLKKERTELSRGIARAFSKYELANVFSSSRSKFKGASLKIELPPRNPERPRSQSVDVDLASGRIVIRHDGTDAVVLPVAPGRMLATDYTRRQVSSFLYLNVLLPELLALNPFLLSAERFGISLFYRELDLRKNQLVAELQRMSDSGSKQRSPFSLIDESTGRYALPVKDNIDYTRSIPEYRERSSEIVDSGLHSDVSTMMNGHYESTGDDIVFVSDASDTNGFPAIPLHLASSSVRGLSDFYFFLRHVARRNHLLIVDEPESHLDTANQILLARLLARLVRTGVKVVLTTHSDYLLKEVNNLVMLGHSFDGRPEVMKRLGYEENDCLTPERIRAYVAEGSGLSTCAVNRFGINMPVFDETIDRINNVANELSAWLSVETAEGHGADR